MDGQMWSSLLEPQRVSGHAPTLEPICRRRRSILISGCILNSLWFNLNSWRVQGTMTRVLHKSSFSGCWNEEPMDKEDGLFINCCFKKALSILPSLHHHGNNGLANLKIYDQTRCNRAHDLVGCWTKPIWYWIHAKNSHQGLGVGKFHH